MAMITALYFITAILLFPVYWWISPGEKNDVLIESIEEYKSQ